MSSFIPNSFFKTPPDVTHVFIAHPTHVGAEPLETVRLNLFRVAAAHRAPLSATLGCEDYTKRFPSGGAWEDWAREVSCGIDAETRKPVYDVVVVALDPVVSRANGRVISLAIITSKPVVFSPDGVSFFWVGGMTILSDDDFKSWALLFFSGGG